MSVRYKFKSEKNFSQILFDGIHVSVADVKKHIYEGRKLGRSENVDLMISNAENNEKYIEDECLIPKNTSLIVVRIPVIDHTGRNKKVMKNLVENTQKSTSNFKENKFKPVSLDLASMKASEEEKIFAMMMQSTLDYQSYQKPIQKQFSAPPSTYICRKCHTAGHWIQNCQLAPQKSLRFNPKQRKENTKMTGIPMSMRNRGESRQFYKNDVEKNQILKNIYCDICKDVFRNPIRMPCCKTSFCNECAIIKLLETDDSECPKCADKFIHPGILKEDYEMRKIVEESIKFTKSSFLQYPSLKSMICS